MEQLKSKLTLYPDDQKLLANGEKVVLYTNGELKLIKAPKSFRALKRICNQTLNPDECWKQLDAYYSNNFEHLYGLSLREAWNHFFFEVYENDGQEVDWASSIEELQDMQNSLCGGDEERYVVIERCMGELTIILIIDVYNG